MNEKDFDCYQRYSALKALMGAAFPSATEAAPASVLDVGSGAVALSQAFLGRRYRVTRSDVSVDPAAGVDVVSLRPGQPLPFDAGAYDAVIAMDVLEHVRPADRPLFVRECIRVAREVCVLAAPAASQEIEAAEARVYRMHQSLLGNHAYFEEHLDYGLPARHDIEQWIAAGGASLVTLANVPLLAWETLSCLDFIGYSDPQTCDLTMDAHMVENATLPSLCSSGPHYRTFYVACRTTEIQARIARLVDELNRGSAPLGMDTPLGLAWRVIAASCAETRKARSHAYEMQVQAAQAKDQLAAARAELDSAQRGKREIEVYLQEQLRLLREYQTSLDAIYRSRSWRYMEAFRKAGRMLRRLSAR